MRAGFGAERGGAPWFEAAIRTFARNVAVVRIRKLAGAGRVVGALLLAGVCAVHVNWATGSAWPARDRAALSRAVIGSDTLPGPGACLAVAGLLAIASALVAGFPRRAPGLRRVGAGVVAGVLFARGAVGLFGAMPHDRRCAVFARWNRRFHSPLCLLLALLATCGACASGEER
jgi:hypothetical protein